MHTPNTLSTSPSSAPRPRAWAATAGLLAASATLLGLAGCAGMSKETRDTSIGAAAGAVVGHVITGSTTGAAVGAVVGGVIGHEANKKK